MTKQGAALGPQMPTTTNGPDAPRTPQHTPLEVAAHDDTAVDADTATTHPAVHRQSSPCSSSSSSPLTTASSMVSEAGASTSDNDSNSEAPAPLEVTVENLTGHTKTVSICATATVLDLKRRIEAVWGVAAQKQELIFGGKALMNDMDCVGDCGIEDASVVRMVVRIRAGPLEQRRAVCFTDQDVMAAVHTAVLSLKKADPSVFTPQGRRGRHAMVVSLRSPAGDEIAQVHVQLKRTTKCPHQQTEATQQQETNVQDSTRGSTFALSWAVDVIRCDASQPAASSSSPSSSPSIVTNTGAPRASGSGGTCMVTRRRSSGRARRPSRCPMVSEEDATVRKHNDAKLKHRMATLLENMRKSGACKRKRDDDEDNHHKDAERVSLEEPPPKETENQATAAPARKRMRVQAKGRCGGCRAKLGLVSFPCRCKLVVCGKCQHNHNCTFDYKSH